MAGRPAARADDVDDVLRPLRNDSEGPSACHETMRLRLSQNRLQAGQRPREKQSSEPALVHG